MLRWPVLRINPFLRLVRRPATFCFGRSGAEDLRLADIETRFRVFECDQHCVRALYDDRNVVAYLIARADMVRVCASLERLAGSDSRQSSSSALSFRPCHRARYGLAGGELLFFQSQDVVVSATDTFGLDGACHDVRAVMHFVRSMRVFIFRAARMFRSLLLSMSMINCVYYFVYDFTVRE